MSAPPARDFVAALAEARAIAVLRTRREDQAAPAMEAAVRGGFRIVEFTLNTPGALDRIEEFAFRDELLVGAGTVLTVREVDSAVERGASFLVSPVVDEAVVRAAVERDVAILPGTHSPTEMWHAHQLGAPLVKLFPAPVNGPAFVRACLGPLPFLRIVPTSGVTVENAGSFLEAGAFAVGCVAPLFDPEEIARSEWTKIEERARRLLQALGR